MSDYLADRIEKPPIFRIAPAKAGRGKRKPYIVGFDSEADTRNGRPMLMQFSLPEHASEAETLCVTIGEDDQHAGLRVFLQFVRDYCTRKDREYIIYGWNLEYEFTQIFHDLPDDVKRIGELDITITGMETGTQFRIRMFNDKRHLMTITNLGTKRQVRVLDGMSFFKTSLDNAAKMLGVGEKYTDGDIDRRSFTRDDLDNAQFLRYARTDAYITRLVGEYIIDMHETYDVTTCISAPHFAGKVFKKRFLKSEIVLPKDALEQVGLWSYHGGKNGFYLDGPTYIPNCYQYDITSAYPEAMRQLPNVETSVWVGVDTYEPGRHAIYAATIAYRQCKFRGIMSVDGKWPDSGTFEAFLTSYELDAMVEREEVDIMSISGWEMIGEPGGPLVEYVDEFFAQKATSTGPKRETAKLFLNSLYGKFFQKVAIGKVGSLDLETGEWVATDPTQPYDYRAGGLYHPPIASLITGFVRAKIHRLEHKYDSIMTSTDGIFAYHGPDPADMGKHLGGLTMLSGSLKIWRERLYIFQPDASCSCAALDIGSHADSCPAKPKWAAHGFRGRLPALDAIPLARGTYEYVGRQMVTLKLSTIGLDGQRYEPGRFVDLPYHVAI